MTPPPHWAEMMTSPEFRSILVDDLCVDDLEGPIRPKAASGVIQGPRLPRQDAASVDKRLVVARRGGSRAIDEIGPALSEDQDPSKSRAGRRAGKGYAGI
jgi:hypothetical protein